MMQTPPRHRLAIYDMDKTITRKAEWPDWRPPAQMLRRRPDLPRFMAGGPNNPLGARALYLGSSLYRIHGSNEPETIGQAVSSGCIRMLNEDIVDLFERVRVGTTVVVPSSTIRAGPSSAMPGASAFRSWIAACSRAPLAGSSTSRWLDGGGAARAATAFAGAGSGRSVASDRVQVSASTSSFGMARPNTVS